MREAILAVGLAALMVTGVLVWAPWQEPQSQELTEAQEPTAPGDVEPAQPVEVSQFADRFIERPAAIERAGRLVYGPFSIPPGQDMNRLTLELPVHGGFITSVAPQLFDAESGTVPTNQQMHIHHAHWFEPSTDPNEEYYTLNLAWVFGTGEERTKGTFNDRSAVEPDGPQYGIWVNAGAPQALIYMIHNKEAVAQNVYVALDVSFVYGAADAIKAKDSCGALEAGETCRAGQDFHAVNGRLWGTTFDVPREPIDQGGDGIYVHPIDIPADHPTRRDTDHLGRFFTASHDGLLVGGAGHLHPNGREVIVANLGPEGSACEADLDGDGLPGITLFRSHKIEQVPDAFPASEEYQMGATKHGFRAPIREGDRIAQFAIYANDHYASYGAMSFAGLYIDRQQPPAPRDSPCSLENTAPVLLEGDPVGGSPIETTWNRNWDYEAPHCDVPGAPACETELTNVADSIPAAAVHIANFLYTPGDRALAGDLGAPVQVAKGNKLLFINEDAALGIRHTITGCAWPCNGKYVANYPHPDGLFDSGKLGNIDPIDNGGVIADPNSPIGYGIAPDMMPAWELDTTELDEGLYSYFCRIHPWMRGAIEVV